MGQRHQAFLIARVIPHGQTKSYYRCIAAVHHQWCYGRLPLRAAHRMLAIIRNNNNAHIIRREIFALHHKYGRLGQEPQLPAIPCPYSSFLLATSWNLDIKSEDAPYFSGLSLDHALLHADMGSQQGDNDDGITVIDVTDPEKPAYCFLNFRRGASRSSTALTAEEYVRGYYPVREDDDDDYIQTSVLENIQLLDGEFLVTQDMLAEAWPPEYANSLPSAQTSSGAAESADILIPSFKDLFVQPELVLKAIRAEITAYELPASLPTKERAQGYVENLKSCAPFPDSGLNLLSNILRQISDDDIDLSSFSLSTEQINHVLAKFPGVRTLKLSHSSSVTIETIRMVLTSIPTLRRIVAIDTAVSEDDLVQLLTDEPQLFTHLEALIHPAFLTGHGTFPYAFSFFALSPHMRSISSACLPFFTPALVVQGIFDYLMCFLQVDYASRQLMSQLEIMGMAVLTPQAIFSCEPRNDGDSWDRRTVSMVPDSSLRAFDGEGWFFVVNFSLYGGYVDGIEPIPSGYAFAKAKRPSTLDIEDTLGRSDSDGVLVDRVLDLRGFLLEMEKEGRPTAPAHAVASLEEIFDQLQENHGMDLLDVKSVESFGRTARFWKRNYEQ